MRDVTIARGVDDLPCLDSREAVFVRDRHRRNAIVLQIHVTRHAVVENRQIVAVLQDQLIAQQLELLDVRNPHAAPIFGDEVRPQVVDMFRARLRDTQLLQQLKRDAFDDKPPARLVDEPIKIRQPDRGDDAAGKARAFNEQRLRAIACRRKRRREAGTAAATDEHICVNGFHGEYLSRRWLGCFEKPRPRH